MFDFRNSIFEPEDLPCTDLTCSWESPKGNLDGHFSAVPVSKFCCAKRDTIFKDNDDEVEDKSNETDREYIRKQSFDYQDLDESVASEILEILCETAPTSAISLIKW